MLENLQKGALVTSRTMNPDGKGLPVALEQIELSRGFAMSNEWQPIETAVKIGTEQILTGKYRERPLWPPPWWYQTSFWSDQHHCWVGWPKEDQPTHWMPLPSPPEVSR